MRGTSSTQPCEVHKRAATVGPRRPVALWPVVAASSSPRHRHFSSFRLRLAHSLTAMHVSLLCLLRVRLGLDEKTGERVALKILKKKEMGMTADVIKQVVGR